MRDGRALLEWYEPRRRAYPWRGASPYAVLVSEVMLQQTHASRVVPAYRRFLARFPTVESLAAASPAEAIRAWDGLGYNRRAVALHRAAVAIVERHGGRVPASTGHLRELPGVGPYTAAAVACFAFGVPSPVVETNVRRVLARAVLGVEPRDADAARLAAAADRALPRARASDWNQALMDLGREVCRSRPRCHECPLARGCAYRRAGRTPARDPNGRSQPTFDGSARQARGRVVALLRDRRSASLAEAAAAAGLSLERGSTIVAGLARDGLVRAGPAALRGDPRGRVRLPTA